MAQIESAISDSLPAVSLAMMTEHDLLEIVEIEQCCGLSPWGWDSYHLELNSAPGAIMLVARITGIKGSITEAKGVAGFVVSRVVADELHINNVAVRPEWQRSGIGGRRFTQGEPALRGAGRHVDSPDKRQGPNERQGSESLSVDSLQGRAFQPSCPAADH